MNRFDPTQPVQTRDKRPAKILRTNSRGLLAGVPQPIIAVYTNEHGEEAIGAFCADGSFMSRPGHDYDLVNLPPVQARLELLASMPSPISVTEACALMPNVAAYIKQLEDERGEMDHALTLAEFWLANRDHVAPYDPSREYPPSSGYGRFQGALRGAKARAEAQAKGL